MKMMLNDITNPENQDPKTVERLMVLRFKVSMVLKFYVTVLQIQNTCGQTGYQ